MNEHKMGCLVCGEELEYLDTSKNVDCQYCKKEFEAEVICKAGHYICDSCHSLSAVDLIKEYCSGTTSTDPLQMALELMHYPSIKMHGPEHHYLIPAVLLTAYYNHKNDPETKAKALRKAKSRAEKVLGGFCGFYGDCGAAVGTGIFISIISGSTPLSKKEWQQSNLMTAKSLFTIAKHGGPRCCKRNTFLAIKVAVAYVNKNFDVKMNISDDIKCDFSEFNNECLEAECLFYKD